MIPGTPRPTSVEDLPPWERYGAELVGINMIEAATRASAETVALIAAFADNMQKEHGLVLYRGNGYWSVRLPSPEGGALAALRRAQESWDQAQPIGVPGDDEDGDI